MLSEAKCKAKYGSGLRILTPKQMPQGLPIVQVKAGNIFENLLNQIRQIIYYLYRASKVTKKHNNTMNSIML